jgi:uncharacterized protein (DUF488 family)
MFNRPHFDYTVFMNLYTVGYEGLDVEDFVKFVKKNKIKLIADLRKNPISRKKGFSKNKLAEQLKLKKIDYMHFPLLGTPSAWRKLEAEGKISRKKLFEMYVDKIIPSGQSDIERLRVLLREQPTALLCYEADANDCHRSFVAKEIIRQENKKTKIVDLVPPKSR